MKGTNRLGLFLATVAAAVILAMPAGAALAADVPATAAGSVSIAKEIHASAQADIAGDKFTYVIEELGLEDGKGKLVVSENAGEYTIAESSPSIGNVESTPAVAMTAAMNQKQIIEDTGKIQFPSGAQLDHAGVWQYLVYEQGAYTYNGPKFNSTGELVYQPEEYSASSALASSFTKINPDPGTIAVTAQGHTNHYVPSQAVYLMRMYVVNGDSGLEIEKVTVERLIADIPLGDIAEDYGSDDAPGKIDSSDPSNPANPSDGNASGFRFTNRFTEKGSLSISKEVIGKYGDKTKEFLFDITLILPEGTEADIAFNNDEKVIEAFGQDTVRSVSATGEGPRTFYLGYEKDRNNDNLSTMTPLDGTAANRTAVLKNVQLHSGGTLGFGSTSLPVGTKVKIEERADSATGYKTAATVKVGNGSITELGSWGTESDTSSALSGQRVPTGGAGITINENASYEVTRDGLTFTITNYYPDNSVSPTGILINNLPYILLIGIPVVALIAWFVVRRRKAAVQL